MGIPEAVIISSLIGAGTAVAGAMLSPDAPDMQDPGLSDEEKKKAAGGVPKGARSVLLSGQPTGILTPGTTNRSRLLGNN